MKLRNGDQSGEGEFLFVRVRMGVMCEMRIVLSDGNADDNHTTDP